MNIWDWIMTPEFCFIFPAVMVGLMLWGFEMADRFLDWWMDWLLGRWGAAKGGVERAPGGDSEKGNFEAKARRGWEAGYQQGREAPRILGPNTKSKTKGQV